jgi:hypothetical protein
MGGGGKAPKPPKFDIEAAGQSARETARFNTLLSQFGLDSPLGQIQFVGEPGTAERRQITTLSPFGQQLMGGAEQFVGDIRGGIGDEAARRAEEAVFGQFAGRFEPQFEREQQALSNQLVNQGIPVGSEAHSRALANLGETQNLARQQAMNQSVLTGQAAQQQQLGGALGGLGAFLSPILGMGQQRIGTGVPQTQDPYLAKMQSDMANFQAQSQQQAGLFGGLGALGGGLLGGIFSDKRLKENIKPVGKLNNGLTVYMFNFKGDNKTQIGLIAQEVMNEKPNAVIKDENGFYKVNYAEAVK